MKRVLVSLLAVLYLAAGLGFTLREHYCMGEKIGAALEHPVQHSDTHRCDRCGMEKKTSKGCCKDEIKVFKASPEQTLVKSLNFRAPLVVTLVPVLYPVMNAPRPAALAQLSCAPAHGPPLRSGLPRYLQLRCLRL